MEKCYILIMVSLILHPHGIAPTFLFVVAGGGFCSYYIHQGNKLDKERKKVNYYACIKRVDIFRNMGAILSPCFCNSLLLENQLIQTFHTSLLTTQ